MIPGSKMNIHTSDRYILYEYFMCKALKFRYLRLLRWWWRDWEWCYGWSAGSDRSAGAWRWRGCGLCVCLLRLQRDISTMLRAELRWLNQKLRITGRRTRVPTSYYQAIERVDQWERKEIVRILDSVVVSHFNAKYIPGVAFFRFMRFSANYVCRMSMCRPAGHVFGSHTISVGSSYFVYFATRADISQY